MGLILISVVTFCLETLPIFHKKNIVVWSACMHSQRPAHSYALHIDRSIHACSCTHTRARTISTLAPLRPHLFVDTGTHLHDHAQPTHSHTYTQPLLRFTIESICIAVFSVEFILRIASAPNTCMRLFTLALNHSHPHSCCVRAGKFMYDVYTLIDIGAIFPYYLEVCMDISDGEGTPVH